jgi:hypothetical protein
MHDISESFLVGSGLDKRTELSEVGGLGRVMLICKIFGVHGFVKGNLLLFF